MLFESGYIEVGDVHLVQAWIASLLTVGYQFPKLSNVEEKEGTPSPSKSKSESEKPIIQHKNIKKDSLKEAT